MEIDKTGFLPFYAGQKVIAVDAIPGSKFINGQKYTVSSCVSRINPANGMGPFTYVGIVGHADGGAHFRPSIFAPYEELTASIMTFEQIQEYKPLEIFINN